MTNIAGMNEVPLSQALDVIECPDRMTDKLSYRIPETGLASVKIGTEVIVHEKQVAILCLDGKFLDILPAGKHVLGIATTPLLNSLITLEENHPTQVPIYFVSTREFHLPWGTPQPIPAGNSQSNMALLQGFGDFSFFVGSPLEFLEYTGGVAIYSLNEIQDHFRNKILSGVTKVIGKLSNNGKLTVLEILGQIEHIEKSVHTQVRKDVKRIGVNFTGFQISNIKPSEKSNGSLLQSMKFVDSIDTQESPNSRSENSLITEKDVFEGDKYVNTSTKNFYTPLILHDEPIGEDGIVQFNYVRWFCCNNCQISCVKENYDAIINLRQRCMGSRENDSTETRKSNA